jgi:ATP-dependent DNA helicase RecG
MPDYDLSDNKVKVTIVGRVLNNDYAMLLSKDHSLSLTDIEMLNRIQMQRSLSNEEIAYLRKHKLVEGKKNALYITKAIAGIIGKKAEYTRNKGLDENFYMEMILQLIDQHKQVSRKDVDELLLVKLPEALSEKQKITKIGHILAKLKKQGKIEWGKKKQWVRCEKSSRK